MKKTKETSKKVVKTNTNCIVDNNRLITEFECEMGLFEFYQVQPSIAETREYYAINRILYSHPLAIEGEQLTDSILKTENEEEKLKIKLKINEIEAKLEKMFDRNKGIKHLIMATFKGTIFQKGKIELNKKPKEIELDDLPAKLFQMLSNNAISLIQYSDSEEKN